MDAMPSTLNQVAPAEALKPEWIRIPAAKRIFGVGRSKLYEWIEEKRVKSISLRDRGKQRGIRLISYDSLAELMEKAAKEEEAD